MLHSLFLGIKAGINTLSHFGNARPSAPVRAPGGAMGAMAVAPIPQMGLREEELRTLGVLLTAGLPALKLFGVTVDSHEEYDTFADVSSVLIVRCAVVCAVLCVLCCVCLHMHYVRLPPLLLASLLSL